MGNTNKKGLPQLTVLLLGEQGVGISSLVWRLETNSFGQSISDDVKKIVNIDGQDVELIIYRVFDNFWEPAKKMMANHIQAVFYCYSASNPTSVAAVEELAEKFKQNREEHQVFTPYPVGILRLKSDLPQETDAQPKIEGASVFDVSSKEGQNIMEPFEYMARRIWRMTNSQQSATQKDK